MDGLTYFLPCIYAFFACIGFSLLFNIHGAGMFICAGGGALGWLCYLLAAPLVQSDIVQSFLAALVISAWSEVMARLRRCPVTSYLLVALFPLVPGIAITNAMRDIMAGDMVAGISKGAEALLIGAAMALGTALALGLIRVFGGG